MKEAMGETTFTIIVIVAAGLIIGALTLILGNGNNGILGSIKNKWNNQINKAYNTKADVKEFAVGNYTFTI